MNLFVRISNLLLRSVDFIYATSVFEAVRWLQASEQPLSNLSHQLPDRLLLVHLQRVGGADMLARHHQHVTIGDWKGIWERKGMLVLNPDAVSADVAEGAGIQTGRIAPLTGASGRVCSRWLPWPWDRRHYVQPP